MHAATKRASAVRLFTTLFNSRQCTAADMLHAVVALLADDFLGVDPDGNLYDKAKQIAVVVISVSARAASGIGCFLVDGRW